MIEFERTYLVPRDEAVELLRSCNFVKNLYAFYTIIDKKYEEKIFKRELGNTIIYSRNTKKDLPDGSRDVKKYKITEEEYTMYKQKAITIESMRKIYQYTPNPILSIFRWIEPIEFKLKGIYTAEVEFSNNEDFKHFELEVTANFIPLTEPWSKGQNIHLHPEKFLREVSKLSGGSQSDS